MPWKSDTPTWGKEDKTDGKSKAREPNSQGFSGLGRPAGKVLGLAWPPPSLTPRRGCGGGKGGGVRCPAKGCQTASQP